MVIVDAANLFIIKTRTEFASQYTVRAANMVAEV